MDKFEFKMCAARSLGLPEIAAGRLVWLLDRSGAIRAEDRQARKKMTGLAAGHFASNAIHRLGRSVAALLLEVDAALGDRVALDDGRSAGRRIGAGVVRRPPVELVVELGAGRLLVTSEGARDADGQHSRGEKGSEGLHGKSPLLSAIETRPQPSWQKRSPERCCR